MLTQLLALINTLALVSTVVDAQSTTAQCSIAFHWADNSLGQSPCLVAAYLEGACQPDGEWTVQALPNPSDTYPAPTAHQANPCLCSSVTYSLVSACADCQGAMISEWQTWTENCSVLQTSNGQYPHPIPLGTAVPAWAYQFIVNAWSPAEAQLAAQQNSPDSSARPSPTPSMKPGHSAPASHTPIFSSSSGDPSPSATSNQSSANQTNLGAIIGGIVGGIIGLGLLIGLGFFTYYHYISPSEKETEYKESYLLGTQQLQGASHRS